MTRAHRTYFAVEMAVAALINAALSAVFVFVVFGRQAQVALAGLGGVAADAAPQSFMIALMSCLVPTLLTRRRLRAGTVLPMPPALHLPRRLWLRAIVVAGVAAAVAVFAHLLILPHLATHWRFADVLAFKGVYGALLGAAIAALAIRYELGAASGGK